MSEVPVSLCCSWHMSSLMWRALLSELVHCSQDAVSLSCVSEILNPWSYEGDVVNPYISEGLLLGSGSKHEFDALCCGGPTNVQ